MYIVASGENFRELLIICLQRLCARFVESSAIAWFSEWKMCGGCGELSDGMIVEGTQLVVVDS